MMLEKWRCVQGARSAKKAFAQTILERFARFGAVPRRGSGAAPLEQDPSLSA